MESSDGTKYALGNIKRLFAAGYRTCSLVHLNDSAFAASASGVSKGGLTPLGRNAVKVMNEVGMIIDLAHAAPRVVEDVLDHSERMPFISHTGAKGVVNDPKNMPDEILRAVADRGGVVGLCFVGDYVGGDGLDDVLRSLEYMIKVVGPKGVALGSGFDSFPTPVTVDQFAVSDTSSVVGRARPRDDRRGHGRECDSVPRAGITSEMRHFQKPGAVEDGWSYHSF